jgi:hypothetical protein
MPCRSRLQITAPEIALHSRTLRVTRLRALRSSSSVTFSSSSSILPFISSLSAPQRSPAAWRVSLHFVRRYAGAAAPNPLAAAEDRDLPPAPSAAELRRQLEAQAEAGDAEAQFKVGVLYCFGGPAAGAGGGCSGHKHAAAEEDDSPIIDPASLDFLIGPGTIFISAHTAYTHTYVCAWAGLVVPKTDGESTRIKNWREWLKVYTTLPSHRSGGWMVTRRVDSSSFSIAQEERRKLKAKRNSGDDAAAQTEAGTSVGHNYALAAKWYPCVARTLHLRGDVYSLRMCIGFIKGRYAHSRRSVCCLRLTLRGLVQRAPGPSPRAALCTPFPPPFILILIWKVTSDCCGAQFAVQLIRGMSPFLICISICFY